MSGHGLLGRMLGDQMIVNGMLVVIAVSTLTFAYRHLHHVRRQRQSTHSRARRTPDTGRIPSPTNPPGPAADGGRWTGGDPWMSPPPRAAAGHKKPAGKPAPARPPPASAPGWDAGSVELAGWILSEANAHAAEIRHEARDEAAASLADAKKEAADLLRQAADQAAAKLAAAESEAAQVQAALMKLSTELGEAAATTLHPAAD
jgi:hypothetical protein